MNLALRVAAAIRAAGEHGYRKTETPGYKFEVFRCDTPDVPIYLLQTEKEAMETVDQCVSAEMAILAILEVSASNLVEISDLLERYKKSGPSLAGIILDEAMMDEAVKESDFANGQAASSAIN